MQREKLIETGLLLNISEFVSVAIVKHNMTINMVCKYLGISRSTYFRIIQCKNYNFIHVIRLAQLFGCTIDDIVYCNEEVLNEM